MKLALAWVCFWIGHVFSLILNIYPDSWHERGHAPFMACYQFFMRCSWRLDPDEKLWKSP